MGEALPGGKRSRWWLGALAIEDDRLIEPNSDILNRHVLQHNVPPDNAKRTPLACQTCRRRKTKCDSNYPCSTCADSGEACVREPSSMQIFIPTTRSQRKGSLGEEKRPTQTAQEEDPDGPGSPIMPGIEDTSPMRFDWIPPTSRSGSNSVANTRPASRSAGTDQDPRRPLTDPLIAMIPGINTPTSTPSKTPPLYFGEPSAVMTFPFDTPVRQPSETRDHFATDQSSDIHLSDVGTLKPSRSLSGEWKLQARTSENDSDLK